MVDKYGIFVSFNIKYIYDILNIMVCMESVMVILEVGVWNLIINFVKKSLNDEVYLMIRNIIMKLFVSKKSFV